MNREERIVAVIPARGGSKSVRRKNVRDVGGKPLLAWSIEVASDVDAIDRTVVSTDSEEIASVAREFNAEVSERPDRLATDDALVIDTLRHLIKELREDDESARYMAMLEPTCPFRAPEDVRSALELLIEENLDSVASFTDAELNPHRAWTIDDDRPRTVIDDADPWQPRQSLPDAYQISGGVYAFVVDSLLDTAGSAMLFGDCGATKMPPERSVDIDTLLDLEFARLIADRRD